MLICGASGQMGSTARHSFSASGDDALFAERSSIACTINKNDYVVVTDDLAPS